MPTPDRKLTEPLATVIYVFGGLVLALTVVTAIFAIAGSGSIGGFGHGPGLVCVTQPRTGYSGDNWATQLHIAAQPGTSISINGTLQACANHPSLYQRALYTLTELPGWLLWAGVLLLLWWLVRTASRTGPFTLPVGAGMRRLGWFIIIGSLAAASAQGAAVDALLNTLLRAQNAFGDAIPNFLTVLPVPLLAGAALLTFARIIHRGAAMDEEIQATV